MENYSREEIMNEVFENGRQKDNMLESMLRGIPELKEYDAERIINKLFDYSLISDDIIIELFIKLLGYKKSDGPMWDLRERIDQFINENTK